MSAEFFKAACQSYSKRKRFGLCDDPAPAANPAYIDEVDGKKWIAVVVNENLYEATFTAIDNCIEIKRPDGKMAKRCDGVLTYESAIVFVELKQRDVLGSEWVKDAEKQLRATIEHFQNIDDSASHAIKKAYIANNQRPKFKDSQMRRMEQFLADTGYVLRIENRIILD
jgi:hypothetical protein